MNTEILFVKLSAGFDGGFLRFKTVIDYNGSLGYFFKGREGSMAVGRQKGYAKGRADVSVKLFYTNIKHVGKGLHPGSAF